MIVSPSFSEVSIHTADPFFCSPFHSQQALCSQAFMQKKHLISIQASASVELASPCYKRVDQVRAPTVRSDGIVPFIVSVDNGGVFKHCVPPLIAAKLLCDETRSTVRHGWFLRSSLAYGLDCAVFDPCIQDRRKMTQTPQVSYTNAVKCARLL